MYTTGHDQNRPSSTKGSITKLQEVENLLADKLEIFGQIRGKKSV